MLQQVEQDLHRLVDIWDESLFGGGEQLADGVGSDLLLNGDGGVDVAEQTVQVINVVLEVLVVVIVVDLDGSLRALGATGTS